VDLKEGVRLARDAIESGAARRKLDALSSFSCPGGAGDVSSMKPCRRQGETARERMATRSVAELESIVAARPIAPSLSRALSRDGGGINAIAEIKRKIAFRGVIREGAGAAELAGVYAGAGASAISVLTCSYRFGGSLDDLREAAAPAGPALLRKDFITEPYQVLELARSALPPYW